MIAVSQPPPVPPLYGDAVEALTELYGPATDEVIEAMEARAEREGFPTVGPAVGRTIALCARLTDATTALELGSGFGYSAYWLARALGPDGRVVLTERDAALLSDARSYFEDGGLADRVTFEHGDALEIAASLDGPFDVVLLDHDTDRYVEGFEVVRESVAPGGVVLTDNVLAYGDVQRPEGILASLEGDPAPNDRTRAVADFFERVAADHAFESHLLPVDDGLMVSVRVEN